MAMDVDGHWWLPETPDERVPGRLAISDAGAVVLTLNGALDSHLAGGETVTEGGTTTVKIAQTSLGRTGVYPRVLGFGGSDAFTLEDCLQLRRSGQLFGGSETQVLRAGSAFRKVHFEAGEELRFDKIFGWMEWLAYWVLQTGLEESVEFMTTEDGIEQHSATTVKIGVVPSVTCTAPDGAEVTLGQSYGVAGDRIVERRLTQDFYFAVSAGALVPLSVLLEQLSDLQDLVSIGTGRSAAYTSLSLRHPDVVRETPTKPHSVAIDMYATWQVVNDQERKTLNKHDMYLTLPDLGGIQGVQRWLAAVAVHRSALSRVMSTQYSPMMFVSDRVFNCAAALEAYDRDKHVDQRTFADRLRRSAALAGVPFTTLVGDVEPWVQALKDARNDVAHHKARMGTVSTEHLFLTRSAFWLFVLCLLRDAQAPEAVYRSIVEHGGYDFLRRRLAEILPAVQSGP